LDSAISSILGRESTKTLLYAIAVRFKLGEGELEKSPLKVIEGLNLILGREGYLVLEPAIISEIKFRFHIPSQKTHDLHSTLEESRKAFLKSP
jgi:hypothetical protein